MFILCFLVKHMLCVPAKRSEVTLVTRRFKNSLVFVYYTSLHNVICGIVLILSPSQYVMQNNVPSTCTVDV